MKRVWTTESASNYVVKAVYHGLKWCSALDYLRNHTSINVNQLISRRGR